MRSSRRLILPLLPLFAAACTSPKVEVTGSGGLATTASSSGSASGGTSQGSSSSGTTGSTGGSLDAGCHHLGQIAELGACVLSIDCKCPLECLPDPQGNLLCQLVCSTDTDCGSGQTCDAGHCLSEPMCDPVAGAREFQPCQQISDCACPLDCFEDDRLGNVCEQPCTSESDCLDAGEFCESDAGSCQVATSACNPGLTGEGEFQACARVSDCTCPLGCFEDPLRGQVCELPCKSESDCADAGGPCELDAGSCQPRCSPGGASVFQPCASLTDCACPLSCVFVNGGGGICAACDGGDCPGPVGSCVDAGPQAAAAQSGFPLIYDPQGPVACTRNQDCDCPNQCLPISGAAGLKLVCQPPLPACGATGCSDPTAVCLFGACVSNFCSPSAQPGDACDLANAPETPPGAGEGECLPSAQGSPSPVCSQGGDGGSGCALVPDRDRPETLCPVGSICVMGDAGSFCASECQNSQQCAEGSNCVVVAAAALQACAGCVALEACLPGGPTCTVDAPTYLAPGGLFDSSSVGIEYSPCNDGDCLCPLVCSADGNLAIVSTGSDEFCERPCQSDADCPLPVTSCANQVCQLNPGGCALGGGLGLGSACDAGDGPGTCIYFSPFAEQWASAAGVQTVSPVAVCRANGPAVSVCNPDAWRTSALLCGAGMDCLPLSDGGFGCQPLCDPSLESVDAGGCGPGEACVPVTFNAYGVNEGTCLGLGDGGCAIGLPSDELASCTSNAGCSCGLECSEDWSSGQFECQRPCGLATDCPLDEVCFGEAGQRSCQLNLCQAGVDTCDADLGADGTCVVELPASLPPDAIPREPPESEGLFDICYQAGTATGACDPSADRSHPDLLCVPGAVCDQSGPSPMCTPLCIAGDTSLSGVAPCSAGQSCVPSASYLGLPASYFSSGAGSEVAVQGSCLPARGLDAGP